MEAGCTIFSQPCAAAYYLIRTVLHTRFAEAMSTFYFYPSFEFYSLSELHALFFLLGSLYALGFIHIVFKIARGED